VTYHSRFGAIQESRHVFIQAGLLQFIGTPPPVKILEVGLGTGLNALLSFLEADRRELSIDYTGIEPYPPATAEIFALNYPRLLGISPEYLYRIHEATAESPVRLSPHFSLRKLPVRLESWEPDMAFHLIYFDAFAPGVQPELWTEDIFRKLFDALLPEGLLVTYSAKGAVRRALQAAGFQVHKLPGPPGKREMISAMRPF